MVFQTERAIDTNIKGAFNVIQSCLDFKVSRIFHPTKPIFKNYWENTYTISKITAENFVRMFSEVYDMNITVLRWMNASGPRQHIYPVRKFIPMIITQALLDKDIEIYGNGNQTVDIIDVRDIAKIAVKSTRMGIGKDLSQVYDVGSGHAISCNDVAKYVLKKINSKSKIVHLPMRIGEAPDTKIAAKTHNELLNKIDYKLEFSYEDTMDACIDYMRGLDKNYLIKAFNFFSK